MEYNLVNISNNLFVVGKYYSIDDLGCQGFSGHILQYRLKWFYNKEEEQGKENMFPKQERKLCKKI